MESEFKDRLEDLELTAVQLDDRFHLIQLIGEGASSKVYKAEHKLLMQAVAVKKFQKEISGDCSEEEQSVSIERFKREASLAAKLVHPGIVRITGYGVSRNDEPFIVMEYCEGESLDKYIQKHGKLSLEETKSLGVEISDALSHAHALGIVHRDIKPANIMVTENLSSESVSRFRLLDFGLAKDLSKANQGKTLTQANVILGTPNYISPEQCKTQEADARSDIYSFGCVLFECVTGRKVFQAGGDLELMQKHLYEKASFENTDLFSPDLKSIILKCLNKNPDDRFKSSEKLRDALSKLSDLSNESSGRKLSRSKLLIVSICLLIAACAAAYYCMSRMSEIDKKGKLNRIAGKKNKGSHPAIRDSHIEQMSYENIVEEGTNLMNGARYEDSLRYFDIAKRMALKDSRFQDLAFCEMSIGENFSRLGKAECIKHFEAALKTLEDHAPESEQISRTCLRLAAAYSRIDNFNSAIAMGKRAIALTKKFKRTRETLSATSDLGLLYDRLRDYSNARKYLQMAYEMFEETGELNEGWRVEQTYLCLAEIEYNRHQFSNANKIVKSLTSYNLEFPLDYQPYKYLSVANTAIRQKQFLAAKQLANAVLEIDRRLLEDGRKGLLPEVLSSAKTILVEAKKGS